MGQRSKKRKNPAPTGLANKYLNSIMYSKQPEFPISQLCSCLAICEAVDGDIYGWGNADGDKPAFLAYVGCDRANAFILGRWYAQRFGVECQVRTAKRLPFECEIKIRGMQRSDLQGLLSCFRAVEAEQQMWNAVYEAKCDRELLETDHYDSAWY